MSSPSSASLDRFQPDRFAERVLDDAPFAVAAAEHVVPRPPRARSGPRFRSRRRRSPAPPSRPAGRCGGCRAARRCPAARARSILRRGRQVDFLGDVGEAAIRRSALPAPRPCGSSRIGASFVRRLRRVLHLVGGGVDRRRVLGGGERVAVAVEQVAAQAGDGDDLGLLVGRPRRRAGRPAPPAARRRGRR